MLRTFAGLGLLLLSTACGTAGVVATPPKAPAGSTENSPTPAAVSDSTPAGLGEAPAGVPAPPAECTAFTVAPPRDCATGDFKERLATALTAAPEIRDGLLRCLEASPEAPGGLVRALRADLAPRACGDAIVASEAGKANVPRELPDALVALGVGARLNRSVRQAPLPRPPFNKA